MLKLKTLNVGIDMAISEDSTDWSRWHVQLSQSKCSQSYAPGEYFINARRMVQFVRLSNSRPFAIPSTVNQSTTYTTAVFDACESRIILSNAQPSI